jgi:protein TonB
MAYSIYPVRRFSGDRLTGAVGAAAMCALIGYALFAGLQMRFPRAASDPLSLFALALPPPPPEPPVLPEHKQRARTEGSASPANLRAKPTDLVAPPPPIPMPPRPLAAAPRAGTGTAPSAGAAPIPGPGTGAGGKGNGSGSGGAGNGDGGGETPLRWIRGRIRDSDYPRAALKAGISGTVGLRFIVGTDGRVTSCTVARSSGNSDLDTTTCRLIMKRFRYIPTRNAQSQPIPDEVTGEHVWETTPAAGGPNRDE